MDTKLSWDRLSYILQPHQAETTFPIVFCMALSHRISEVEKEQVIVKQLLLTHAYCDKSFGRGRSWAQHATSS